MSYKEFEKRVVELFLEDYSDDSLEEMMKRIDDEVMNDNNFIRML